MYQYKTKPFEHQREIFERTRDDAFHGLLWEQGCGKSKPIIDTCAHLYEKDEIDCLLIIAPNGVHRNWITDEIPTHMPDRVLDKTRSLFWRSNRAKTLWYKKECNELVKHQGLVIFTMNYESFITEMGKNYIWRLLRRRRCLYVLDESDDVKTPKAKRTRSITASGKYAPYRRILTGTPADKPFDIYSQLRFLNPRIWADRSMEDFLAFKRYFAEWFTAAEAQKVLGYDPGYDKLISYKNLEELSEILLSCTDRLLKEDVLDLPPKLYTKLPFEMTPRQWNLYNELREELEIEFENGDIVDGTMALTRLLRFQQIACGYVGTDNEEEPITLISNTNPRLEIASAFLKRSTHPCIVWARFRKDVDLLMDVLGPEAVRYDGMLTDDEAEQSKLIFNKGGAKYFVGTQQKGSRGLTLNVAKTTVFYSNSFKLRDRLQAEDRDHRIGQDGADHGEYGFGVLNADVLCPGTVDEKIVLALRGKFDVAAQITGDKLREWI